MARGRHVQRRRHRLLAAAAIFLAVVVLAAGGAAWAAYRYELARADVILPGVRVGGVDVSGMTRREATRAVREEASDRLGEPLTVTAAGSRYLVTPEDLGKRANVGAAIDAAFEVGRGMGTFDRFWHRFREEPVGVELDLAFRVQGREVDELVARIAEDLAIEPRDAALLANEELDAVRIVRAEPGRKLPLGPATAAVASALDGGVDAVRLRLQEVAPKITDRSLGKTIVVRVDQNRLYLYDGFEVEKTWSVATGKPGYLTPPGVWTIWDKRENPTWYNPALDSWGAGLPAVVPGGPGAPMGTRAIYIDAPGLIRIHGTPDDGSIGRYASHGCIRMHNWEVEDLFERIDVGAHVIVLGTRPADAGYWDSPPAADI